MSQLQHRRIVLGVGGGIAAYKSLELVRRLRDAGAEVQVVMTRAAREFVGPLSFQALSGREVRVELFDPAAEAAMGHIELARFAELLIVAPASADLIARLAHGLADDLLTTVALATAAPLALAPAMNQQMWAHPAVAANLATLVARGVGLWGPGSGAQACGDVGAGRMLEPAELSECVVRALTPPLLAGLRIVVSAGPTVEDIDPVRMLANRSSGRMGFALAQAAWRLGADVTLLAGPVALATPFGAQRRDFRSTAELAALLEQELPSAAIYVSAAAVCDYRPAEAMTSKHKREASSWMLTLVPNPDLLAGWGTRHLRPFLVGFAAETDHLLEHARAKRLSKGVDLMIANLVGVGRGIDTESNAATLIGADLAMDFPEQPKIDLAHALWPQILKVYRSSGVGRA